MANTAQPRVRVPMDVLRPSPPNLELPQFDHRTLSLTYPIPSEWLEHHRLAMRSAATTINATQVSFRDDANSANIVRIDDTNVPDLNQVRFYESISVQLINGAVSPINVQVAVYIRDNAGTLQNYIVDRAAVTNPGFYCCGPILVLPGEVLYVETATNGGAGDTATVRVQGHQQEEGMPIVMSPAFTRRSW